MAFFRTTENFTCEHCGTAVTGDGYTNHCPACLWSKHVDIHPGDRAARCGGMMKPVRVEGSTAAGYVIVHRCIVCGHERRQKTGQNDSTEALLAIVNSQNSA
ncbi:MAG TPA: RNHCP domain-containing protein [Candidatus Paceibacterota bacterium]|nr:RNHCP domain-containing protein [Candidatus Paceibacterota bacterium]